MIIAGSSSFWKEALSYKKKFEKNGYKVLAYPKRDDGPQTWRELYEWYYKELFRADDIFVLNAAAMTKSLKCQRTAGLHYSIENN